MESKMTDACFCLDDFGGFAIDELQPQTLCHAKGGRMLCRAQLKQPTHVN